MVATPVLVPVPPLAKATAFHAAVLGLLVIAAIPHAADATSIASLLVSFAVLPPLVVADALLLVVDKIPRLVAATSLLVAAIPLFVVATRLVVAALHLVVAVFHLVGTPRPLVGTYRLL